MIRVGRLDWAFGCALALSVAACASEPKVDALIDATSRARPDVVGVRGPLSEGDSRAIIERLNRQNANSDVLQHHIALQQALVDNPLIMGNRVQLLRDGPETFTAMFAAMEAAKQSIELEYFTLEDVELNGKSLGDLLVASAGRGVRVSILYDAVGSIATPGSFFDRLRQAGIAVQEFNPIQPISLNHRDHRKILIADNSVAIVGGVNLSTVYSSVPFSKPQPRSTQDATAMRWRDTDMKIAGPAIGELQKLFLEAWEKQAGTKLPTPLATSRVATAGDEIVRVIGSTPDDPLPLYYIALLSAIRTAARRLPRAARITRVCWRPASRFTRRATSFFTPNPSLSMACGHRSDRRTSTGAVFFSMTRSMSWCSAAPPARGWKRSSTKISARPIALSRRSGTTARCRNASMS